MFRLSLQKIPKDNFIYSRNQEIIWLFGLLGYKTIFECHDWFPGKKKFSLFLLKKVNYLVCTNEFIRDKFVENGFTQEILVAPNGVDLKVFDISLNQKEARIMLQENNKILERIKEKKILLYTGSFKTMGVEKGISEIIKAMKAQADDTVFVAVGGNKSDIEFYQKMAAERGVEGRCYFFAKVKQAELAVWQKAADVFLMPFPRLAHYEYHMTPLKMFEYMAGGRPIIASSLPSIRQILNEKNCFFCKPGDSDDLSMKIKELLSNGILGKKLAVQALQDVKNYSWGNRAKKIIDFIK